MLKYNYRTFWQTQKNGGSKMMRKQQQKRKLILGLGVVAVLVIIFMLEPKSIICLFVSFCAFGSVERYSDSSESELNNGLICCIFALVGIIAFVIAVIILIEALR